MAKEQMPDLEAVYDEKIAPLMKQIIAIVKEHRMPMLASFAFAEGCDCTTVILDQPYAPEKFKRAQREIRPAHPVVLAETYYTDPATGNVAVSIRTVK